MPTFTPTAEYLALSDYDKTLIFYSDYFKDINGFRPRGGLIPDTLEGLNAAIDSLDRINEDLLEAEAQLEQEAKNERQQAANNFKEADTRFAALKQLK